MIKIHGVYVVKGIDKDALLVPLKVGRAETPNVTSYACLSITKNKNGHFESHIEGRYFSNEWSESTLKEVKDFIPLKTLIRVIL